MKCPREWVVVYWLISSQIWWILLYKHVSLSCAAWYRSCLRIWLIWQIEEFIRIILWAYRFRIPTFILIIRTDVAVILGRATIYNRHTVKTRIESQHTLSNEFDICECVWLDLLNVGNGTIYIPAHWHPHLSPINYTHNMVDLNAHKSGIFKSIFGVAIFWYLIDIIIILGLI